MNAEHTTWALYLEGLHGQQIEVVGPITKAVLTDRVVSQLLQDLGGQLREATLETCMWWGSQMSAMGGMVGVHLVWQQPAES